MLTPENLATVIVLGPSPEMRSRIDWSKPRTSDVIPTIDVTPMTMPSTVRMDRSLLERSVSHDIVTISAKRVQRTVTLV